MKLIKSLVVIAIIIGIFGMIGINYIQKDVSDDVLPENVYTTDSNLMTLINADLIDLFVTGTTDEYTVVEEILNLTALDSIRKNVNDLYDPLADCDTTECNFIVHEEYYYVNYVWAELTEDNQMMIHISVGSDKVIELNTVLTMYFDIEFDYLGFGVTLVLDKYDINDHDLSLKMLDRIFGYFDKDSIEASVSTGELDLDNYSYTISFIPFS